MTEKVKMINFTIGRHGREEEWSLRKNGLGENIFEGLKFLQQLNVESCPQISVNFIKKITV